MWLIITFIALFAFWEKYRVKTKQGPARGRGEGVLEKFYTRRLRVEVRPLTILYIPFLTEKVPLSYT